MTMRHICDSKFGMLQVREMRKWSSGAAHYEGTLITRVVNFNYIFLR